MLKADHSGHRSRLKKKYLKYGIDSLEPHEVLELLLFYAIPQRDTNNTAKSLLDYYGSISTVFDSSIEALKRTGLTEHQALLIKLIPDVTRRYMIDKYEEPSKALDMSEICSYVIDHFIGYEHREHVYLLLVDKKGKEVFSGMIAEGNFNEINVNIRDIVALAANYSATAAIIAHNHPSGLAMPSSADIEITYEIKEALSVIGVSLIDHFIIADHDCISCREMGIV